jgi:hypothetical protein
MPYHKANFRPRRVSTSALLVQNSQWRPYSRIVIQALHCKERLGTHTLIHCAKCLTAVETVANLALCGSLPKKPTHGFRSLVAYLHTCATWSLICFFAGRVKQPSSPCSREDALPRIPSDIHSIVEFYSFYTAVVVVLLEQ